MECIASRYRNHLPLEILAREPYSLYVCYYCQWQWWHLPGYLTSKQSEEGLFLSALQFHLLPAQNEWLTLIILPFVELINCFAFLFLFGHHFCPFVLSCTATWPIRPVPKLAVVSESSWSCIRPQVSVYVQTISSSNITTGASHQSCESCYSLRVV